MAVALLSVFDVDVVQNIHDFIPRRPHVDWEEIGGYTMIYKTNHLMTYTGRGDGGYVYVYKERLPGWYRWNRSWGREPTYAYIDDGVVAVKWTGDVENIRVLPNSNEEYDWLDKEDDVLDIMTYDFIRLFGEPNDIYGP